MAVFKPEEGRQRLDAQSQYGQHESWLPGTHDFALRCNTGSNYNNSLVQTQYPRNPNCNYDSPGTCSYSYFYRQQMSSARPRPAAPASLNKYGPEMRMGGFGNLSGSANYLRHNSRNEIASGRSNSLSPTFSGLIEVVAPYMPRKSSTVVFMEPRQRKKCYIKVLKYIAFAIAIILITIGVGFLHKSYKPDVYPVMGRIVHLMNNRLTTPHMIETMSSETGSQGDSTIKQSTKLNEKITKDIKEDTDGSNLPNEIRKETVKMSERPIIKVKPLKTIYSNDEDDGEVKIEIESFKR